MVDPHELSGGNLESPYSAAVRERDSQIASHCHDERAEEFTAELLELEADHPGLLKGEKVAEAVSVEAHNAAVEAVRKRNAGLLNDDRSEQLGIFVTGTLEAVGWYDLRQTLEAMGAEYQLEAGEDLGTYTLYKLYLPEGAFRHNNPKSTVYPDQNLAIGGKAEVTERGVIHFDEGFLGFLRGGYSTIPQGSARRYLRGTVGRIECSDGKLWQNPHTDGAGRVIPVQSEAA